MPPYKYAISWLTVEAGQFLSGLTSHGAGGFLSPEEHEKYSTLHHSRRSADWLLGRRAAKTLLRRACPDLAYVPETAITIANEPSGAPYISIDGRGRYPGCLSITHRHNLALAAYCAVPGWRIGIDLEQVEARQESFLLDFFTANEVETAHTYRGDLHTLWVTLAWSAKESALKALGTGLRLDTRSVEIGAADELEETPSQPSHWQPLPLRSTQFSEGCACAWWQPRGGFVLTMAVLAPEGQSLAPEEISLIEFGR